MNYLDLFSGIGGFAEGFPDGWTEGVSETARYKALGNAVTVDVVCEIAKRLKELE